MNFRAHPSSLLAPLAADPLCRVRYNPRRELTDEALAGVLWMSLDVPQETTLEEVKEIAQQLAQLIRCGAGESLVEAQLAYWQREHFCLPANADKLRALARRVIPLAAPR